MEDTVCLYDRYIKEFRCKYYITKSTKKFLSGEDTVKCYGVRIDKLDDTGKLLSTAKVDEVGINEDDVRSFLKVLKDGQVTPITLNDIVTDMLIWILQKSL